MVLFVLLWPMTGGISPWVSYNSLLLASKGTFQLHTWPHSFRLLSYWWLFRKKTSTLTNKGEQRVVLLFFFFLFLPKDVSQTAYTGLIHIISEILWPRLIHSMQERAFQLKEFITLHCKHIFTPFLKTTFAFYSPRPSRNSIVWNSARGSNAQPWDKDLSGDQELDP